MRLKALRISSAFFIASLFVSSSWAAPAPSADSLLSAAEAQAQQQHKNILVTFDASWCGNCHLFDHMLADPTVGPLLARSFVHLNLTTGERPKDRRHTNTPGAVEYQEQLGGKNAGWPYLAMLDPHGNLLVDSFRPASGKPHGENIGYPATPAEISWFIHMLHVAAPELTAAEIDTVDRWLQKHSPV